MHNLVIDKAPYLDAFIEDRPFPPFEIEIQVSSNCNLMCRWCIGDEIQGKNEVKKLRDEMNIQRLSDIVDNIIKFQIDGLGVRIVKFSGFIGEPLMHKETVLNAIGKLVVAGKEVGLFTNGILMDQDTWQTLSRIRYVHISLDAGKRSHFWLKETNSSVYSEKNFERIIENICGLNEARVKNKTNLNITVGYIIVPGNHDQIFETVQLIKAAGADSIRFKADIGGKYSLKKAGLLEQVSAEIQKVKSHLQDDRFSVFSTHTTDDMENETYQKWNRDNGCYFHHFLSTIGSDCKIYLCDHNSMPGAIPLGHAVNDTFSNVWQSERRKYLTANIKYICQSPVCPPFGNALNVFLEKLVAFKSEFGIEATKEALKELRDGFSKAGKKQAGKKRQPAKK